jgi:predicted 3-demethylubiquinone-9 3-methyltransferase (glyoxalase superfamily)
MRTMSDEINIAPCLWFKKNAEEAARFYAATFPEQPRHRGAQGA